MKTIENKLVMKQANLAIAKILVVIILFSGIGTATGASKYTLAEAQAYALENSYFVKNTSIEISKARKKVWETISTGLPQATGSSAYNKFLTFRYHLSQVSFLEEKPEHIFP